MPASAPVQPMIGYCTNVHAGVTCEQTIANLRHYTLPVKQQVAPDTPMGVGLWLSAQAARELIQSQRIAELRDFLDENRLVAFTLNGFPFGDFHRPRVKHDVYQPDWREQARFDYTLDLVHILSELLPDGVEGSISTLPVGWRAAFRDDADEQAAAERLIDLVHYLARNELDTGKLIHVDLEPEPGCLLDTGDDVIRFFNRHLLDNLDEKSVRAYLRICHDICHAAVMFEDQVTVLRQYEQAGLMVGKVQVSSAVRADFGAIDDAARGEAATQLRSFAEDRYLHQTVVRPRDGTTRFYDDLPKALAEASGSRAEWRVHFHVPIHLPSLGRLATTQSMIEPCLAAALAMGVQHFEIETYAWNVLPTALRVDALADGIAKELTWLNERMTTLGAAR